jgi:bacterioferritin-associated ferredoxin
MSNVGAVGSGLSCGIDSLHVLLNQTESQYSTLNITHLLYNNVGSHGVGKPDSMIEHEQIAEAFAKEMGYKLIKTDSNFAEIFEQVYSQIHTFSNCFAVYMLQKLWNVYFYASSGWDFSKFNLKNNDSKDSAYYDLLSLNCFSTQSLRIYSEGGAKTRFEKTKMVIAYPPAGKYLNVCCAQGNNCGICEKCMRTLLTLDALNALDKFKEVFDIDYYHTHKNDYYTWLCVRKMQKDNMLKETFDILSRKITFSQWMLALFEMIKIPLRKVAFLRFLRKKTIKITETIASEDSYVAGY